MGEVDADGRIIRMDFEGTRCKDRDWIHLA
jgi:hypothetical protein